MINWISSEDEKNTRKIDFDNLYKIINFVKSQNSEDDMVKYACELFDEYKDILCNEPKLLRDSLSNYFEDEFDYKGKKFFCISPAEQMEDINEGELLIYEVDESGEEFMLNPIEDEALLEEVYGEYCRRYDEEMECDCGCEHEDCSCCHSDGNGCDCGC